MYKLQKFSLDQLSNNLSVLGFLAIFPFFIIYNLLLANGIIPPFLGGYFGVASAILAAAFLLVISRTIKLSFRSNFWFSFFNFSAFIMATLITLVAYYAGSPEGAVFQSIQTLVFWFGFYSLGFYFIQNEHPKINKFLVALIIFFTIYNIWFVATTGNLSFTKADSDLEFEDSTLSGYQSIARNLLIISLLCYTFIENKFKQVIFLFATLFCMFAVGARSEFAGLIFSILVINLLLSFRFKFNFVLSIVIVLATSLFFFFLGDVFSESRQLQLLNFSDSTSWNARQDMQALAVKQITENPILGYFGGHVLYQHTGTYAHNALSAYVNYGLIFFIIYFGLNLYSFIYSLYKSIINPHNKKWLYCLAITSSSLLLVIFAKPVFWPIPFLAWGLFMGALYSEKKGKQIN